MATITNDIALQLPTCVKQKQPRLGNAILRARKRQPGFFDCALQAQLKHSTACSDQGKYTVQVRGDTHSPKRQLLSLDITSFGLLTRLCGRKPVSRQAIERLRCVLATERTSE